MKIRITKTASGAQVVQIVKYKNNRRIILQHIASAHSDSELNELKILANDWIKNSTEQVRIFFTQNCKNAKKNLAA